MAKKIYNTRKKSSVTNTKGQSLIENSPKEHKEKNEKRYTTKPLDQSIIDIYRKRFRNYFCD